MSMTLTLAAFSIPLMLFGAIPNHLTTEKVCHCDVSGVEHVSHNVNALSRFLWIRLF